MDIDTSDRTQQRNFGIVMAGAIGVLGLVRWAMHREGAPLGFFYVAGVFLALGLIAPRVLEPVLRLWLKFALALNWVMTRVLLTVAFFCMIVPTRLLIRLFGNDPLKRTWEPEATTYWEEPEEQPVEFDRYLQQF